jgi:NAD(P)-dependent dehydrogenase (short-subunit alcohol dehydrogenase family)
MSTLGQFDMTGRRAIVTGACGLLGREFCGALVDVGAEVFGFDRADADLDGLERHGVQPVACDVTDAGEVHDAVRALASGGEIDAVVTSAAIDPKVEASGEIGGGVSGDFVTYPLHAWAQTLTVNLTGTFLVAQAVGAVMQARPDGPRGSIVTIGSTYGLSAPDQELYVDEHGNRQAYKPLDYPTTKAGVVGFTRALAAYYRGTRIRVNCLVPGGAYNGQDEGFVERYSQRTLLLRMADPAEYRGAIAFLCSDASSYMTGAQLVVDGGWTAI